MKTRVVQCPFCLTSLTVGEQVGGKISCALGGALLGGQAMKNPIAIVVCGAIGLVIGHYIDTEATAACPQCGQLLKIAGVLLGT
jgi:hypothetical protein